MKVAELKRRLQVGIHLRLVNSLMGPCDKLRVVDGYDSVDVWFTGDGIKPDSVSHLRWPKATELRETPRGFEILEGTEVAAAYEWVDIATGDLEGDLVSLTGMTEAGRAFLAVNFPIKPEPDGSRIAEHEVLGSLEKEVGAAGLTITMPPRAKRAVDAMEEMLRAGTKNRPDYLVENHGSLGCIQPLSEKAREWLQEHVRGEQTWQGGGLMVEPSYLLDLVMGMQEDGLVRG